MDPQVGQLVSNKYRLARLIGDGGMGSVFEAKHELLGTTVALKFLHSVLARRKGLVDRFLQEAQVSARIKSPHVVTVHDVDRTPEGLAYMVMEYVEGETLQTVYEKNYQAGKQMSYREAFDIMLQILDGVGAAHALGIVHRDLKPDNVILSPDPRGGALIKVLDFGIAKLKASGEVDRGLTRPGVVMGTPEYMAPEQAFSADRVDSRADIFSLGVMFYEMLAGRRPVGGDNAHSIAAHYLEGQITRLDELMPDLDPDLVAAVHRAMAAQPEDRFEAVTDFRDAIVPHAPKGAKAGLVGTFEVADRVDEDEPVPKTVPPEELYWQDRGEEQDEEETAAADPAISSEAVEAHTADGEEPHAGDTDDGEDTGPGDTDDGLENTGVARAEAERLRGGTAAAGDDGEGGTAQMEEVGEPAGPLRAGTEPMPHEPAVGGAVGGAAVPPTAAADAPGATMVGDDAPPPQEGYGPPAGHAPAAGGYPAAAPHVPERRPRKSKGGGILSMLLIAAAASGLVVGGVYLANQAQSSGDDDQSPASRADRDRRDDDATKEPEPQPAPEPPSPDREPPPVAEPDPPPPPPPPRPQPPRPQPPRPQPQPQPPEPQPPEPQPPPPMIPTVVPSRLPTSLPFPVPGLPGVQRKPAPPPPPPPPPRKKIPVPKRKPKQGGQPKEDGTKRQPLPFPSVKINPTG